MYPELPNLHALLVFGLILVALVLFALERIRLESAALLVLISLLLVFSAMPFSEAGAEPFEPTQLFKAFGSEALIAICALMILGKGVETTQALRPLVGFVSRNWSRSPRAIMFALLMVAAILSAFLNNTPIVVVLLAPLVAIAQQNALSPAKLLLPFGLATIVGGMATTIGTSTNLLVVTLSAEVADVAFTMFDFTWYVAIAGLAGLTYLWLLAPKLTPARQRSRDPQPDRQFVATLRIRSGSPLEGATVSDMLAASNHEISIEQINDSGSELRSDRTLQENDQLFVRGPLAALKQAERALDASLTEVGNDESLASGGRLKLIELVVMPESGLAGMTVADASHSDELGVTVLALNRAGIERQHFDELLADMKLQVGDILLCEGSQEQVERFDAQSGLLPLYGPRDLPRTSKSTYALLIVAAVVLTAAISPIPIAITAVSGVGLMLATGCLGWNDLAEALDRRVILVIVVSLALGHAMMETSGDAYLAALFNQATSGLSSAMIVTLLMFSAALLTNLVTNNATAVIGVPIAIQIASQSGLDPRAIILAVLFGANLSFMTPIGYQTNLLVFSAGALRFTDFARVGGPLTLIVGGTLSWLICWQYGLL